MPLGILSFLEGGIVGYSNNSLIKRSFYSRIQIFSPFLASSELLFEEHCEVHLFVYLLVLRFIYLFDRKSDHKQGGTGEGETSSQGALFWGLIPGCLYQDLS